MNKTKRHAKQCRRHSLRNTRRGGMPKHLKKNYEDGSLEGDFEGRRLVGVGTKRYDNGEVYEGEFDAALLPHGQGTYTWPSGHKFIGSHLHNVMDGQGQLSFPDGSVYDGEFKHDKQNGNGVMRYADGNVYEGQFANDAPHGIGKYTWANGDTYEGQLEMGRRHGRGKLIKTDGHVYEGEFKNDKVEGEGQLTYPNGSVYTGKIREINGVMIGKDDMPHMELIPRESFHLLPPTHMFTDPARSEFVASARTSLGISNRHANELFDELKEDILKSYNKDAKRDEIKERVAISRAAAAAADAKSKP